MNRDDSVKSPFVSELHSSPRLVLAVFIVAGAIIHLISYGRPQEAELIQFGLLIHSLAVILWIIDSYWPKLGPWLISLTLVCLILLGHTWLQIPAALLLISIPAICAMNMIGFAGAFITATVQTALLLGIPSYTSSGPELGEISMAVTAIWITLGALYLWHLHCSQLSTWAWEYYQNAQAMLEAVRNERTIQKQLEADLLLANRELARLSNRQKALYQVAEEARQTKEQFVANVSHELRTPLNMIIGFSDIISRSSTAYGVKLPPTLLADIAAIRRNSQHLAKLVDDVLDLSQIEIGRMALSKEWISFEEIVDQAIIAVRPLYESKKLYLETQVPADLPLVFCDKTRIRQVLINLLSNAGRFTEKGGVCGKIRCEQDTVVISVSDTGRGIVPEEQERLFEPFYQVDSSLRRSHGGSGLGLTISKQFVEMHRGKMWVKSELGVGTSVNFSLPLTSSQPTSHAVTHGIRYNPNAQFDWRTEPSKAPAPKLKPHFVLLEEGKTLLRLFTRYKEDVEVSSVQDVAGAVRILSHSPAHALIVNAASFSNGHVSTEQMAILPHNTPVITCLVAGEDEAAQQLGVNRYLVKPITCETLHATLAELGDPIETVLLVDDNREVLQLFTRMLVSAQRPYRVLQTTSGRRALSLLRERRPDVMLLDLMMPKMDGFQVLEQKYRDPSICHIPVVVISAKDPSGQPIVSQRLTVTHSNGLSAANLLSCIQAVSEILAPGVQAVGRVQPKKQPE